MQHYQPTSRRQTQARSYLVYTERTSLVPLRSPRSSHPSDPTRGYLHTYITLHTPIGSIFMERIPITNPHPGAPNKRKLSSLSGLSPHRAEFPRKRSATACQLCRNRKTKCDNGRPVCASCCELGAECVYMDQTSSEP